MATFAPVRNTRQRQRVPFRKTVVEEDPPKASFLEQPRIDIPELDPTVNPIQRRTGEAGGRVTNEDRYGPKWVREQIRRREKKFMNPYFQFFSIVAGICGLPFERPQGGSGTAIIESLLSQSSSLDDDIAEGIRMARASAPPATAGAPAAGTSEGGLQTSTGLVAQGATKTVLNNRWRLLAYLLERSIGGSKVGEQDLKIVDRLFEQARPNSHDWATMLEHSGRAYLTDEIVAGANGAFTDLVDQEGGTVLYTIDDLIGQTPTHVHFAQLVAFKILVNLSVNGRRQMPDKARSDAQRTYQAQLARMFNMERMEKDGSVTVSVRSIPRRPYADTRSLMRDRAMGRSYISPYRSLPY